MHVYTSFAQFLEHLVVRLTGPRYFRLIFQPAVAIALGVRDDPKDAGLWLASEALLDVLYAGLQRRDLLLQRGEVTLEDLAPAVLVCESDLDPAQRLRDRVILLLESFESPVDLIEVPEHVPSQVAELAAHLTELAAHLVEPTVDLGELASQEFDQLLVLGRGHCP